MELGAACALYSSGKTWRHSQVWQGAARYGKVRQSMARYSAYVVRGAHMTTFHDNPRRSSTFLDHSRRSATLIVKEKYRWPAMEKNGVTSVDDCLPRDGSAGRGESNCVISR